MKILVTGGLGYIGSHTVVELYQAGHEAIIIDDLSNSQREVHKHLEELVGQKILFEELDILDLQSLYRKAESFGTIDGIIHFAARKSVPESLDQPLKYYSNNLKGLINLLEVSERHSIDNFVFSSSCTVYGEPEVCPITEGSETKLSLSPYGNTKLWAEQLLQEYTRLRNPLKTVLLRYFNPVGAHPSAKIGELPKGVPSNLMPYITQTAAGWQEELKIYGNDYDTKDGTAIRDYIHVMDLAGAHIKALEWLASQSKLSEAEVFNIGTGKGNSVREVVQSFERTSGIDLPYRFVGRRQGDIEKIWADSGKANKILGWKPQYDLDDMTASAWKWQQTLKEN